MSYENLKDKICTFEVMDVRGKKMDFFPALKARAAALKNGEKQGKSRKDICSALREKFGEKNPEMQVLN